MGGFEVSAGRRPGSRLVVFTAVLAMLSPVPAALASGMPSSASPSAAPGKSFVPDTAKLIVSEQSRSLLAATTGAAGTISARALLTRVATAADTTGGYNRAAWKHWIDADKDGCGTRKEVLIAESVLKPRISSSCAVYGRWYSYYDGKTWTKAADVDIDHVVALAEAWRSGAKSQKWSLSRRQSFANDLGYPWSLQAVTDNVNSAKSDRDPASWLPPRAAAHCAYAVRWTAIKYRWHLTMDRAEKAALGRIFSGSCGTTKITPPRRAF